jgi:hypothetical protein
MMEGHFMILLLKILVILVLTTLVLFFFIFSIGAVVFIPHVAKDWLIWSHFGFNWLKVLSSKFRALKMKRRERIGVDRLVS